VTQQIWNPLASDPEAVLVFLHDPRRREPPEVVHHILRWAGVPRIRFPDEQVGPSSFASRFSRSRFDQAIHLSLHPLKDGFGRG
jgi:hypothetical protein